MYTFEPWSLLLGVGWNWSRDHYFQNLFVAKIYWCYFWRVVCLLFWFFFRVCAVCIYWKTFIIHGSIVLYPLRDKINEIYWVISYQIIFSIEPVQGTCLYVGLNLAQNKKRCGWNSKGFNRQVEYLNPSYSKMTDLNYQDAVLQM